METTDLEQRIEALEQQREHDVKVGIEIQQALMTEIQILRGWIQNQGKGDELKIVEKLLGVER